jgi:hypothetical protein
MVEAVNLTYKLLDDDNPYELPPEGSLRSSGHLRRRVNGFPEGLCLVDGTVVPGGCTAATNPAHTIAALAERCIDSILSRDF